MYQNDLVLLDKIIKIEMEKTGGYEQIGNFFEFFASQQVLKNYDLTKEEIESSITDGGNDGGLDAIFTFVNGTLISEDMFPSIRSDITIQMYIFTSKHDNSFKQVPLNNEISTIIEFFDLTKQNNELTCIYNENILEKRASFQKFYINNITRIKSFQIHYYYVSRGDSGSISDNVNAKAKQLISETKNLISDCVCDHTFFGATELLKKYRESIVFNLSLPCSQVLPIDDRKYLVLCSISDYFRFISTDEGELKRYLFDSNVRDFNGTNKTNEEIYATLDSTDSVDFWWLNNGITILSSNAQNVGSSLMIENVQIVNGLQTSFTIFDYFKEKPTDNDSRKIMIKVITETDPVIRDRIIKATNSQTPIQEETLHATDKIQRDIETILLPHDFYYERRANFYKNQGKDYERIVTPLYMASCFIALIDKNLHGAIKVKQKFMVNEKQYNHVYSEIHIGCWPRLAKISKLSEWSIEKNNIFSSEPSSKKFKILRIIISFLATSLYFKTFDYTTKALCNLDMSEVDKFEFEKIIKFIFAKHPSFNKQEWSKKEFIYSLLVETSEYFHISDFYTFVRKQHPVISDLAQYEAIYNKIKKDIPPQPWKPGVHRELGNKYHINHNSISQALSYGISIGDWHYQCNGILFDENGNIIKSK